MLLVYYIFSSHQRKIKLLDFRNGCVSGVSGAAGVVVSGLSKEVNILRLDYII